MGHRIGHSTLPQSAPNPLEAKSLGRRGHVAVSLKYAEAVTGEHVPVSGDRQESGKGKKAELATEVAVGTALTPLGLLFLFAVGYLITSVNGVTTKNAREGSHAVAALPPNTSTITLGYAFPSNLGYMPNEARVLLGKKETKTN